MKELSRSDYARVRRATPAPDVWAVDLRNSTRDSWDTSPFRFTSYGEADEYAEQKWREIQHVITDLLLEP